jgi:hypothetical protein
VPHAGQRPPMSLGGSVIVNQPSTAGTAVRELVGTAAI